MRRCDPCRLSLASLMVGMAALPASAQILLSEYPIPTADSSATNGNYGIQTFGNPSSVTSVSVIGDTTGNFVRFHAPKIASDGTEGYTANIGLLHPFTPDWAEIDIRGVTGIRFQYRLSDKISDRLSVSFGSQTYTAAQAGAQTVYENSVTSRAALAGGGGWKEATLDLLDFATPAWWTPPADFPTLEDVLKRATNLVFTPSSLYTGSGTQNGVACTKCVGPDMPKLTMDIRKVVLEGLHIEPPPPHSPQGYLVSSYSQAAPDSAKAFAAYGIVGAANSTSKINVTVPGGFVRLDAPVIASDSLTAPKGNGYTAYVGLLHPLRKDWPDVDLRKMQAIRFEYRNSDRITDALEVSFGSSSYSQEHANQGTVYLSPVRGAVALAADTVWKTATLDMLDFYPPIWWTAPADYPTLDSVLGRVRSINFTPQSLYSMNGLYDGRACTKCVGPTMSRQTLDIRNIRLLGIDSLQIVSAVQPPPPPPPFVNDSCKGSNVVKLDDFQDGDAWNLLGGLWYPYADSGRFVPEDLYGTIGNSSAYMVNASGMVRLDADLDKSVGEVWHSKAGWAGLSTNFMDGLDLDGFSGIQFTLQSDSLDQNTGLLLKVHQSGGVDDSSFYAPIQAKNGVVCMTKESFQSSNPMSSGASLKSSLIDRFSWEARIMDETHPFISKAKARFTLRDVKLYGVDPVRVSRALARTARHQFDVAFQQGALRMTGIDGLGRVEIRDLKGRTVATFAAASRVPLMLSHGTYVLSAMRGSVPLVRTFAVMGR